MPPPPPAPSHVEGVFPGLSAAPPDSLAGAGWLTTEARAVRLLRGGQIARRATHAHCQRPPRPASGKGQSHLHRAPRRSVPQFLRIKETKVINQTMSASDT